MKYRVNRPHGGIREHRYPQPGDQLDAVWKALIHLDAQGIDIGQDGRDMIARIKAVKDSVPKLPGTPGVSVIPE